MSRLCTTPKTELKNAARDCSERARVAMQAKSAKASRSVGATAQRARLEDVEAALAQQVALLERAGGVEEKFILPRNPTLL